MARGSSGARFYLLLAVDVISAACCAVAPLIKLLSVDYDVLDCTLSELWRNSNLDILSGVLVRCVVYLCARAILLKYLSNSQEESSTRFREKGAIFVVVFHHTIQLGLLAKMVFVAAHGESGLLPEGNFLHSGLLPIYCSCLSFLLFGYIEKCMMMSLLQGKKQARRSHAGTGPYEPLLSGSDVQEKRHSTRDHLLSLLSFLFQDVYPIIAGLSVGLLAAVAEASVPFLTGKAIEYSAISKNMVYFQRSLIGLVLAAVASGVLVGIQAAVLEFTAARVGMRLRTKFFYHLLQQEVGFFDAAKTGELISRLHTDIGAASDTVAQNVTVMLRSILHIFVLVSFMFVTCWRLTVVSFVLIPFTESAAKFFGDYFAVFHNKIQSELAGASSVVEESLSSIRTVRAHAAEGMMVADHKERMRAYFYLRKSLSMYICGWVGAMTWAPKVVTAVALYLGGYMVMRGEMGAGDLVAFMFYQQALSQQSNCLIDFISPVTQVVGAIKKVLEIMKRRPKVGPAEGLVPEHPPQSIELRSVLFAYPTRPNCSVLNGMSLMVNPGEFVVVIGPGGSGKSSILSLLQRFYLPDAGDVVIDGRDVGVYDPGWLKHNVGIVPEEPVLFSKSIKDNVLFGADSTDDMESAIESACCLSGLHDFVASLPEKYATECGENGVQLSKTQKWKLAVARAIICNPSVLLMDDVPALDFDDSEDCVERILERCREGRTVLLTTRRVSVARKADRIIVVENGQVAETGSHTDLVEMGGVYASFVGSRDQ